MTAIINTRITECVFFCAALIALFQQLPSSWVSDRHPGCHQAPNTQIIPVFTVTVLLDS
jgi:hypothetical protein